MARKNFRISLRNKIKINEFIEHLCGPEIEFYCYQWFAMNYFELIQFILVFIANSLLILSF